MSADEHEAVEAAPEVGGSAEREPEAEASAEMAAAAPAAEPGQAEPEPEASAPTPPPVPAPPAAPEPPPRPVLVATPAPSSELETPLLAQSTPLRLARPNRYRSRFAAAYVGLGAVLAAALAGLVVLVVKPGVEQKSAPWSSWRPPSGSTAQVETAIANHVAAQYHLTKGGAQLVGVVAEAPAVTSGTHKVTISAIAVRKTPNSDNGIAIYPTSNTWTDEFCGLGPACSISSGQATVQRGRLVRREALEVALYTFKFAPAVSSLVTFMPPPPGQVASTLLYFQKSDLTQQLSEPLAKTLPLATPPLPSSPDKLEAATIDKLTLPAVYSYSLTQLQDGSAALVLDPVLS